MNGGIDHSAHSARSLTDTTGGEGTTIEADPFDRVYEYWAGQALSAGLEPPSKERWDSIVLRLVLSEDPDRIRRYRWLEATWEGSLGADAYDLWLKMPAYTVNRTAPARTKAELQAYELAHRGSMRRLMQAQGLGARYEALVQASEQYAQERRERARRGQMHVALIGCAGMALIALMMLTVLLVIAVRLAGRG
jgi:hypothetical protein